MLIMSFPFSVFRTTINIQTFAFSYNLIQYSTKRNINEVRLKNLMQHFGILRRKLKEGIRYNESEKLQEVVIARKRRNQSVIGARIVFPEHRRIA
ncbi:MAG: hypothetical protein AUJ60_09060 [Nitrospirae bacterium CG1_02_44_142]|nr:MAG: hypothetical protein AUJ60_09060 [Nitrospirae bacterium CG1_02_44_142]